MFFGSKPQRTPPYADGQRVRITSERSSFFGKEGTVKHFRVDGEYTEPVYMGYGITVQPDGYTGVLTFNEFSLEALDKNVPQSGGAPKSGGNYVQTQVQKSFVITIQNQELVEELREALEDWIPESANPQEYHALCRELDQAIKSY